MLRRDAAARIISRRPARGHLYSRMAGAGLVSSEEVTMGSTDSATSEADRGRGRRVGGAGGTLVGMLAGFAAAGVGGVSLVGGSGTAANAVLGALLLGEIQNILELTRISIFAEQTLQGASIVIAVAIYAVVSRRLRRPVRRQSIDVDVGHDAALAVETSGE